MIQAYGEGVGVEGTEGEPRCGTYGACPGNQKGTCVAGLHGDKATKVIRAVHEGLGMPG